MNHQICDACETVAHCKQHGCIPVQPTANTEAMRAALKNLLGVFESQNAMLLEVGTPQIVVLRDQARAALAQAEQRQEAVGRVIVRWAGETVGLGACDHGDEIAVEWIGVPPNEGTLLYASPQPKEPKQHAPGLCKHASSGCNYPEGECSGACFPANLQRQAS